MQRLSRSTALKVAAILSFVLGIYGFVASIPYLTQGDVEVSPDVNQIPYFVVIAGFTFSIVLIVGAYGTWRQQRWGIVLTLIANAIDGIFTLPGIIFAPTVGLQIGSIIGVMGAVVVIVLCLWRNRRPVPT